MNRKHSENLTASLLALTVAAPMCLVLQLAMGIGISPWYTFLFAAGSLLLLELICWNRAMAIAIPVGIALLCAFVWWALGKDGREAVGEFFQWALSFLVYADSYPYGYGVLLTAIASFLMTLFVWLFGRKFFCFPVLFIFVVAAIILKWLNGMDSVLVPGAIACGGLVLLWAKSFQRKTAKKTNQQMPANGIALFLLPVAALMVLFTLSTVTEDTARGWQNRQVYDLFERVNNYLADYTNFNRPRNVFSIATFGFMPMGDRLGGPIKPTDTKILYVSAPRQMLLRGTVYNSYTGAKWTDTTGSPPLRLDKTNRTLSENTFDLNRPALTGADKDSFDRFIESVTISIDPLLNSPSTLFVPSRGVTEITSDRFLGILPKFNARGEAFNTYDIHPGYSYKVKAENLVYNANGFDEMMDRLMALGMKDTPEQEDAIKNAYLALPENIDSSVYSLTKQITTASGVATDYDRALAIRKYLQSHFKYTLTPSVPPEGSDFVSYFLNTDQKGYCTYFASAMAVMARIAGIPSRYVEGYELPDKSPSDPVYTVTGKEAHAWAELYFEGIGWIPFDATPSGDSNGNASAGGNAVEPIPTPTHPESTGTGVADLGEKAEKGITWAQIVPWLWTLPAGLVLYVLLWVIYRMVRARVRVSIRQVRRNYKDSSRCSAFYYFETLKLLEYYNYPVRVGETPYAYAARIDKWLRLESGTFAEAAHLISLISYSDYVPTDKDVQFMAGFRRSLAKYTYQTVGPWFYLWHQVLGFKRRINPQRKS